MNYGLVYPPIFSHLRCYHKFCLKTMLVFTKLHTAINTRIRDRLNPQGNYPYPHWAIGSGSIVRHISWWGARFINRKEHCMIGCIAKGVCYVVCEHPVFRVWRYVIFNFLIQLLTNRFLPIYCHTKWTEKGVWCLTGDGKERLIQI